MQISRTIRRAEIEGNEVTVFYSHGGRGHFSGIDPAEFKDWERSHWNLRKQPTGVHCKLPIVEQETEEIQAELDAEAEIAEVARRERRVRNQNRANEAWRVKLGDTEYRRRFGDAPTFRLR